VTDDIIVVKTDLDPQYVNRIGMAIFSLWMDFALGRKSLGGRRLAHPTGRYAASLQYLQEGEATVAIIADPSIAPEASILEEGHPRVDLKQTLEAGRGYPMHRFRGGGQAISRKETLRRSGVGASPPSRIDARRLAGGGPSMWAEIRRQEANGFASFGPNSDPDSWIVPAMPAYAPAKILSDLARDMISKIG
jgi:hypothetical protein